MKKFAALLLAPVLTMAAMAGCTLPESFPGDKCEDWKGYCQSSDGKATYQGPPCGPEWKKWLEDYVPTAYTCTVQ